jgi:hypothetical protein
MAKAAAKTARKKVKKTFMLRLIIRLLRSQIAKGMLFLGQRLVVQAFEALVRAHLSLRRLRLSVLEKLLKSMV